MRCQGFRYAVTTSAAALGLMIMTVPAMADESSGRAITPRQIAHCMMQRLHDDRRGDRSESYRDAYRACKEDLTAAADLGAASAMMTANATSASK
jgi:hypothetical protein